MRSLLPALSLVLLAGSVATAQERSHLSAQIGLGLAVRKESNQVTGATDGFYAVGRVGLPLRPGLGVVSELSLTSYPDEPVAVPVLCPQPGLCSRGAFTASGFGLAGIAFGLQPRFGRGPVQVLLTATAGGYWMYRRPVAAPSTAAGFRGSLGLGLRIDPRVRVLLEGSGLYLAGHSVNAANSRQFGLGLVLN
jgi:hypothetical protein